MAGLILQLGEVLLALMSRNWLIRFNCLKKGLPLQLLLAVETLEGTVVVKVSRLFCGSYLKSLHLSAVDLLVLLVNEARDGWCEHQPAAEVICLPPIHVVLHLMLEAIVEEVTKLLSLLLVRI
jgi:hypothetical protein